VRACACVCDSAAGCEAFLVNPMVSADVYLCMYRKPAALHSLYTLAGAFEERIRATPEGPY